jgi:hypothetical protein
MIHYFNPFILRPITSGVDILFLYLSIVNLHFQYKTSKTYKRCKTLLIFLATFVNCVPFSGTKFEGPETLHP